MTSGQLSSVTSWLPASRNPPTPYAAVSVDLIGWWSDGRCATSCTRPSSPLLRTDLVTMPCHAFSTTGRYVAFGRIPALMPHAIANVKNAVPLVSGPGKSFGSPRSGFQNPSERWMPLSVLAIFRYTRMYSARRGSFAGRTFSTLASAIIAQPLPRDQNVVVLTYLLSRHHSPADSLNRPCPPATF